MASQIQFPFLFGVFVFGFFIFVFWSYSSHHLPEASVMKLNLQTQHLPPKLGEKYHFVLDDAQNFRFLIRQHPMLCKIDRKEEVAGMMIVMNKHVGGIHVSLQDSNSFTELKWEKKSLDSISKDDSFNEKISQRFSRYFSDSDDQLDVLKWRTKDDEGFFIPTLDGSPGFLVVTSTHQFRFFSSPPPPDLYHPSIFAKPVIYCYPQNEQQMEVRLELHHNHSKLIEIPASNSLRDLPSFRFFDWTFTAKPNGEVVIDNEVFPYLFWESIGPFPFSSSSLSSGDYVRKEDLIEYFDETLTKLGLSLKEQNDFKEYWIEILNKTNKQSFLIKFLTKKEIDEASTLETWPQAKQTIRVMMAVKTEERINEEVWKAGSSQYSQTERNEDELLVVEWGGILDGYLI